MIYPCNQRSSHPVIVGWGFPVPQRQPRSHSHNAICLIWVTVGTRLNLQIPSSNQPLKRQDFMSAPTCTSVQSACGPTRLSDSWHFWRLHESDSSRPCLFFIFYFYYHYFFPLPLLSNLPCKWDMEPKVITEAVKAVSALLHQRHFFWAKISSSPSISQNIDKHGIALVHRTHVKIETKSSSGCA